MTLLNLGFVYAYPSSPYHDPQKARHYLDELQIEYPRTLTSAWATVVGFDDRAASAEEFQRRLRTELRHRDAMIRKLREQLNRSREIDIEVGK